MGLCKGFCFTSFVVVAVNLGLLDCADQYLDNIAFSWVNSISWCFQLGL